MQILDLFTSTQVTSTIEADIKQLFTVLDWKMKATQNALECCK